MLFFFPLSNFQFFFISILFHFLGSPRPHSSVFLTLTSVLIFLPFFTLLFLSFSFTILFSSSSLSGAPQWLSDDPRMDSLERKFLQAYSIQQSVKRLTENTYLVRSNQEQGISDHDSIISKTANQLIETEMNGRDSHPCHKTCFSSYAING